ncbi:hypothetical protein XM38_004450 [Halomicronema hongdechloris C2206]|uniref:Ice-binding protein C-terminal domain-containing protein n=1 Tax=Halomicronema hongdechloris C2206 TaxID=1641165 RepID=A0A1Z3HGZ2_9CYAN|nr:choice-of-anchor L domain-containing protein [Halomicronema hongdechloris]ASC69518.1 hypothetical protein XM38_004450 [Halomicronema hongdechloris C2206]
MRARVIPSLFVAGAASFLGAGAIAPSAQAISITPTDDPNALINEILGPGISVTNITYTGASGASGLFTGGNSSGLGFDTGIILTNGLAADAVGPNGNGSTPEVAGSGNSSDEVASGASTDNGLAGDPDLDTLLPVAVTEDATVLQFDFESEGGDLFFNYVFGSEEYIDFEGSEFNDVFGFFLDGVNIALIPGTSTPVAINNVNSTTNSGQFNQNINPATVDLEYDGFTNTFTAQALGLSAGTHTLKLAIADASDSILDSGVFIETRSVTDDPPDVPEPATGLGLLTLGGLAAVALKRQTV